MREICFYASSSAASRRRDLHKKPGRRPLPDHLPRREIVHDLSDDQKFCHNGHPLKHIGSDISERLTIIPMQLEVERHIRHKYVCPTCSKGSAETAEAVASDAEPEVITAPATPTLIPGSIATPSLLAHLRRRFFEASKGGSVDAEWFSEQIGHLYRIENNQRDATPQKRLKARRQHSAAIVAEIRKRTDAIMPGTLRGTLLGKALKYMINEWPYLTVFLKNGNVPIDNNPVENAIRPFVIGRKNWLFNDSQRGASASAFFYGLIQTAKTNGHEPYWYLRYLLEKLPMAGRDSEKLRSLLPLYLSPDQVNAHFGREK